MSRALAVRVVGVLLVHTLPCDLQRASAAGTLDPPASPKQEAKKPEKPKGRPGSWELGLWGGVSVFSPDGALGRPKNDPVQNPMSLAGLLGGRIGWFPLRPLGLELEGGGHVYTWWRPAQEQRSLGVLRGSVVLAAPAAWPFRPFLLAGLGGQFLGEPGGDYAQNLLAKDKLLLGHAGLGFKGEGCLYRVCLGGRVDARANLKPQIHSTWPTVDWEMSAGIYLTTVVVANRTSVCEQNPRQQNGAGAGAPKENLEAPTRPSSPPAGPAGGGASKEECVGGPAVAAAPPPSAPRIYLDSQTDRLVFAEGKIVFETGKKDLNDAATRLIEEVIAFLASPAAKEKYLRIEGHTDSTGERDDNKKLSGERAQAVADWMYEKKMVSRDRMRAVGCGEEHPIGNNKTDIGKERNRRIEFYLYAPENHNDFKPCQPAQPARAKTPKGR